MKGGRQGSHLVPLNKPAIGLASPPDSALRRSQKKVHLLSRTFVLRPDMAFLVPQSFLLKHTVTSPRTWRMCCWTHSRKLPILGAEASDPWGSPADALRKRAAGCGEETRAQAPGESPLRRSESGTYPLLAVKCAEKPVLWGDATENKYQRDRTEKKTGRVRVLPGWDCRWDYPLKVARRLNWKLWAWESLYFTNYIILVLPSFPLAPEWMSFLPTSDTGLTKKRKLHTLCQSKEISPPDLPGFLALLHLL